MNLDPVFWRTRAMMQMRVRGTQQTRLAARAAAWHAIVIARMLEEWCPGPEGAELFSTRPWGN